MAEYKCINCGEIRQSEKPCNCLICGAKMFATPYDRKEMLISEIKDLIMKRRPSDLYEDDLKFARKEGTQSIRKEADDEKRFPDIDTVYSYALYAEKTEEFFERVERTIEQISKHIHTPYSQTYTVYTSPLFTRLNAENSVLKKIMEMLNVQCEIQPQHFEKTTLTYSETPDSQWTAATDELLGAASLLTQKARKFIKVNNIYGTNYRITEDRPFEKKEISAPETFDKQRETAMLICEKKYYVDIFSDGTEELKEMLNVLWDTIALAMDAPCLAETWAFRLEDGRTVDKDGMKELIGSALDVSYKEVDAVIQDPAFLQDRNEDDILELYAQLDAFAGTGENEGSWLGKRDSEKKLDALIGLSGIKESIKKIKAYALMNKDSEDLNIHMCFYGNPGTGKTEVARIIAGILHENGILPTDHVVEVDRGGLVADYVGQTPHKTMQKVMEAMGGVLFVDEAYALVPKDGGDWDYGHEAIATLIKAMEDYRGKFCVILAGYHNEMQKMLQSNPGFVSRIQFTLDFPNYSREELGQITDLMIEKRKYSLGEAARSRILDITDLKRKDANFANAREIRNLLDQVIMCQNMRCLGTDDKEITLRDVEKYINDAGISLPTIGAGFEKKVLTGEEELDSLVGLASVKRMVRKIKAYAKHNQNDVDFNLHMCFYGNPGTGKTEVARVISRILYDAGVLGEAKLVETDAHGLMGKFVGETAPKTQAKIDDAMNGVLFVDEAYGLTGDDRQGGGTGSYGEEAIAVLLKAMEDNRGKFCVILAGYQNEMKKMISSNPGLASRVQFTLDFPDYSKEELGQIAERFLFKKNYEIEPAALARVLDVTEYYRARPNFANARTVRNILDQVIMNQNLRVDEEESNSRTIILQDVEDYILDEGLDLGSNAGTSERRIGFI